MANGFPWRGAIVLVVIAALTALTVGVVAGRDADATRTTTAAGSSTGTQVEARVTTASTTSSLPEGADQVDGMPTGFPHDEQGAVATAVAVTRAQIGFDTDQAAAVAAVYADPAERVAFEELAQSAVGSRREQAGISPTQEPPAPTAYAATPLAYTVTEVGPDHYAVHLLSWITLTSTTAEVKDHLYVGTQLLTWSDDDWRLTMPTADLRRDLAQQQPPAATPGTEAFARAGWVLIEDVNR
jgi:hypothetical protein